MQRFCETSRLGQAALEEAQQRLEALQALPASEPSEELIAATVQRIDRYATRRAKLRKYFGRTVLYAAAAASLLIGIFHVYYYSLKPTPYDLHVVGQSSLLAGSPGSMRLAVFDQRTGRPLGGVPIRLALYNPQQRETVQLASLTTDEAGGASPRFEVPDWPGGSYELRITAQPGGGTEQLVPADPAETRVEADAEHRQAGVPAGPDDPPAVAGPEAAAVEAGDRRRRRRSRSPIPRATSSSARRT